MPTRIGVLSDTHLLDEPVGLIEALQQLWGEVDLILHAGDVLSPQVIAVLSRLAETRVVAGNRDRRPAVADWPRTLVVTVGRWRIGLTHGDFMRSASDMRIPPLWRRLGWSDRQVLHAYLLSQFPPVHAIVFGHTHRQHNMSERGVLFFNPGAFQQADDGYVGTVGLLIVDEQGLRGEILSLPAPPDC